MNSLERGLSRFATDACGATGRLRTDAGVSSRRCRGGAAADRAYFALPACPLLPQLVPVLSHTKVRYDEALLAAYARAALAEVDRWADAIGHAEITSVYVGGGTPTHALTQRGPRARTGARAIPSHRRHLYRDQPSGHQCRDRPAAPRTGREAYLTGCAVVRAEHLATLVVATGRRGERALAPSARERLRLVNVDIMFALRARRAATSPSIWPRRRPVRQ